MHNPKFDGESGNVHKVENSNWRKRYLNSSYKFDTTAVRSSQKKL